MNALYDLLIKFEDKPWETDTIDTFFKTEIEYIKTNIN